MAKTRAKSKKVDPGFLAGLKKVWLEKVVPGMYLYGEGVHTGKVLIDGKETVIRVTPRGNELYGEVYVGGKACSKRVYSVNCNGKVLYGPVLTTKAVPVFDQYVTVDMHSESGPVRDNGWKADFSPRTGRWFGLPEWAGGNPSRGGRKPVHRDEPAEAEIIERETFGDLSGNSMVAQDMARSAEELEHEIRNYFPDFMAELELLEAREGRISTIRRLSEGMEVSLTVAELAYELMFEEAEGEALESYYLRAMAHVFGEEITSPELVTS